MFTSLAAFIALVPLKVEQVIASADVHVLQLVKNALVLANAESDLFKSLLSFLLTWVALEIRDL